MLPQVERPGSLEKVITALKAVLKLLAPFDEPDKWHRAELLNGWVNNPATGLYSDSIPAAYTKDPLGRVHLRGWLSNTAANNLVLRLPPQYRPTHVVYWNADLIVLPDGSVVHNSVALNCYLNGVNFDTREW